MQDSFRRDQIRDELRLRAREAAAARLEPWANELNAWLETQVKELLHEVEADAGKIDAAFEKATRILSGVDGNVDSSDRDREELIQRGLAAGVGLLVVPQSLARLHHRRDLTYRPMSQDAPQSRVALSWPEEQTTDLMEEFIGIVRGRTVNSSRGRAQTPPAAQAKQPAKQPTKQSAKQQRGDSGGGRTKPTSTSKSSSASGRSGSGGAKGAKRGKPRGRA